MAMDDSRTKLVDSLAHILHQTAEDHHVAYKETDGVDPDWSIWYAGHLLELGFDATLDATILKSDLIYLLVLADKQQAYEAPGAHWERWYADFFITRYVH
jgi:hypothetical protein